MKEIIIILENHYRHGRRFALLNYTLNKDSGTDEINIYWHSAEQSRLYDV